MDAASILERFEQWARHRGPLPTEIPPPPEEWSALRRWAIEHGVLDHLDDPASQLEPKMVGLLDGALRGYSGLDETLDRKAREETLTLADLFKLVVVPSVVTDGRSAISLALGRRARTTALKRVAVEHLHEIAWTRAAALASREALSARAEPPAQPALRQLFQRLDAARDKLGAGVTRRSLGAYWPLPLELREGPLRLAYTELEGVDRGRSRVSVELLVDEDPIVPRCTCPRGAGTICDHQLAALDAAMDLLRDPRSPVRPRLAEVMGTPPWSRFLAAFGQALAVVAPGEAPAESRLIFRLNTRFNPPKVELAIQKIGKRGGWSSGKQVTIADLATRRDLRKDPRDTRALAALSDGSEGYTPSYSARAREQAFRVLSALIGHPRVFFEGQVDVPVKVLRVRLRLIFETSTDGVVPVLALGDRRVLPGEALAAAERGERVILVDEARAQILLATLDERERALLTALDRHPASFPTESHDALLRQLEPLQGVLPIDLPAELTGESIAADRRLVVRISPIEGSVEADVSVLLRPLAGGPLFPPGEGPAVVLGTIAGKRVAARRALEDEQAAATTLLQTLPIPAPGEGVNVVNDDDEGSASPFVTRLSGEDALLDLLAALRALGDDVIVEWPDPKQKLTLGGDAQRSGLKLVVRDSRDWFGVEGEVSVEGEVVSFAALLAAVRRGRRYVEVSPHHFARIEDDLRKRVAAAGDVLFEGRHGLELGVPGAGVLADLVDDLGQLSAVVRWRDLVQRLDASRVLDPPLPEGLRAELRHYQLDGFRWLSRLASWGIGGCLADDMGLGKTVQALALLLQRAPLGPALVVAPTSVVSNWVDEAARFAPSLRPIVYRGPDRAAMRDDLRPGDLLLISYGLLTRDAEPLAEQRFATLILDEAQAIKNAFTRRARAVRALQADFRVALTGTPVENHLGELWSLMRVLAPGLFGSWDQFRERFAVPIERARDPERSAALARTLRPFVLRRTKAEVTPELPERTEIARVIDLSAAERKLYDEARRAALLAIASGEGDARFVMLAALTRLRRLACHPRLIDPTSTIASSKLAALMEIVAELRETDHRALVFSQFTTHLALVREALDREQISYTYLDGSTPVEERARRIAAFQKGTADLFLISLKAGGTGLNLTAADYVIHLDPWWNPAVEDQATDRAHRIGQTRPVTVIRLISRGTIEESVLSLHGEKRALSASLFDEEGGPSRLSVDDLASLIREGAELGGGGVVEDEAGDALGEEVVEEAAEAPVKAAKKGASGKGKARLRGTT